MAQPDLKKPLSKAEMNRLAMFLTSPEAVDALDLVETHGLLTAVVSAPGMVRPSLWEPLILGKTEFQDTEQAHSILGLIMRFFNQIVTELSGKTRFLPLEYSDPASLKRWCRGYYAGAKLDQEWVWDDYGAAMLLPFAVLSGEFGLVGERDQDGKTIEDQSEDEERYRRELPGRIQEFHDHWGLRRIRVESSGSKVLNSSSMRRS